MTPPAAARPDRAPGRNWRVISLAIAALALTVFFGANAHLIYMAFASQPDCVAHEKAGAADPGAFGAAKSSC